MTTKTGSIIGLIFGLAIIIMGVMAVLSGEESAKGPFLWVPMLFGLIVAISNLISLFKKQPQPSTVQPLQQNSSTN